ncbi:hypothetical protein HYZ70_01995 [Candidatus Curtissbacteria bacterium]|nr:hypothetical protein [Candidatus Curtissbacteria bacterium]
MEKPSKYSEALDEFVRANEQRVIDSLAAMSQDFFGRLVSLERTFRDGRVTHEVLPERLAEMVVAMIPYDPEAQNVARAKILYSEAPTLTEELKQALIRVAEEKVRKFQEILKALKNGEAVPGDNVGKNRGLVC